MNFGATIKLAITRILSNKTRSFLTMLGVIIGVAALVALTSVAQGATSGITDALEGLGARQVTATSTTPDGLTEQDAEVLRDLGAVDNVYAQANGQGTVSTSDAEIEITLVGVTDQYAAMAEPEVAIGSFLPDWAGAQNSRETVLSAQAAADLGLTPEAVGTEIRLNGQPFTLIGILDDSTGFGSLGRAFVTMDVARTIFAQYPYVTSITVQAQTDDQVDALTSAVDRVLRERNGLSADDEAFFTVSSLKSLLETLGTVQATLSLLLGGIASLSLVVGGVGIMNIMLVSVRERTREIGVRRAIGAKQSQILTQFLIEAIVLSVIGGLIGLGVGLLASYGIAQIGDWAFIVAPNTIVLALTFSALVGIVFGAWPARTAAKLAPVDALRFE